jgi:hypothetical protein
MRLSIRRPQIWVGAFVAISLGALSCLFLFLTVNKIAPTTEPRVATSGWRPPITRSLHGIRRKLSDVEPSTKGQEHDDIEHQLHEVTLSFCIEPTEAQLNHPIVVTLFVEWKKQGSRSANRCLNQVDLGGAKVGDIVLTELYLEGSSTDISIETRTDAKLVVPQDAPAHWTWQVTPKVRRPFVLVLDLLTLVTMKAQSEPEEMEAAEFSTPPIQVTEPVWEMFKSFVKDLDPISTGLVSLVSGLTALGSLLVIFKTGLALLRRNKEKIAAAEDESKMYT